MWWDMATPPRPPRPRRPRLASLPKARRKLPLAGRAHKKADVSAGSPSSPAATGAQDLRWGQVGLPEPRVVKPNSAERPPPPPRQPGPKRDARSAGLAAPTNHHAAAMPGHDSVITSSSTTVKSQPVAADAVPAPSVVTPLASSACRCDRGRRDLQF